MKLQAKIKAKYLDDILAAKKKKEYRQLESIELTDETGRTVELEILDAETQTTLTSQLIAEKYPDIPWKSRPRITVLGLGKILKRSNFPIGNARDMTQREQTALYRVIQFLAGEERHYEETPVDERKGHIWPCVKDLGGFLDRQDYTRSRP